MLHRIVPSTDLCGIPLLHSLYYLFQTTFNLVDIDHGRITFNMVFYIPRYELM